MKSPFPTTPLTQHDPLCGRVQEILTLCEAADGTAPTVLYGPKLLGKTTVLDRVQSLVAQQGAVTVKLSLKGLGDARDLAGRILAGTASALEGDNALPDIPGISLARVSSPLTGQKRLVPESDPDMSGADCLSACLEQAAKLLRSLTGPAHLVMDDMEGLALLDDRTIEAALSAFLAETGVPVLFAGCREPTLLPMFKGKGRPLSELSPSFFALPPLPESELLGFIIFQFTRSGKTCPRSVAETIAALSEGIPHYAQRLAHLVFARTEQVATPDLVTACATQILQEESGRYEQILTGLSPKQGVLLKGIARFKDSPVFASNFLKQGGLSHSTVQRILPKLINLDLIVRRDKTSKTYRITDPFLAEWLYGLGIPA